MEVQMKINARTIITARGESTKDVFAELAGLCAIFGQAKCGLCGHDVVLPVVRVAHGYTFYELRCQNDGCRAQFKFGQAREGGDLLPQRKDKQGNWKPNGGWERWQGRQEESPDNEPSRAAPIPEGPDVPF